MTPREPLCRCFADGSLDSGGAAAEPSPQGSGRCPSPAGTAAREAVIMVEGGGRGTLKGSTGACGDKKTEEMRLHP